MDVFVGRQAILDQRLRTHGYELLFRAGEVNEFDGTDGAEATSRVIVNTYLTMGADSILGGKLGFINFPRALLVDGSWRALPRGGTVIELLETILPDREVMEACRKLKSNGYRFALDDYVGGAGYDELLGMADYVKVDFRLTGEKMRRSLAADLARRGVRAVAEKVETREEYESARGMGYTLFQGFFFTRPVVIAGRDIRESKSGCMNIIRELQFSELDFPRLENSIRQDLSVAHKLLRYVNSALYGRRVAITSIREAIVILGEDELRRWLSLIVLARMGVDQPPEAVTICLARARFCEAVAEKTGNAARQPDYFLMGLFSLLDLMLGRPLGAVLGELKLPEDVTASLLQMKPNAHTSRTYALARACEGAQWATIFELATQIALEPAATAGLYADAVAWSDRTLGQMLAA